MTGVEDRRGRELEPDERTYLQRIMREEDRVLAKLDDVLGRRDALLRDLRWGRPGRGEVMPETLRAATRSVRHPDGLGRTTLHRAVGRRRDRESSTSSTDDEQEQRS